VLEKSLVAGSRRTFS